MTTLNNETIVTTDELMEIVRCGPSTIKRYKKMGMPKFGWNKWIAEEVKNWIKNELPYLKYKKK